MKQDNGRSCFAIAIWPIAGLIWLGLLLAMQFTHEVSRQPTTRAIAPPPVL